MRRNCSNPALVKGGDDTLDLAGFLARIAFDERGVSLAIANLVYTPRGVSASPWEIAGG